MNLTFPKRPIGKIFSKDPIINFNNGNKYNGEPIYVYAKDTEQYYDDKKNVYPIAEYIFVPTGEMRESVFNQQTDRGGKRKTRRRKSKSRKTSRRKKSRFRR